MARDAVAGPSQTDIWLTPPYIIEALGPFFLDPCAPSPSERPWETAVVHYYRPQDGLALPWHGRVWCNPPYGRETAKWLEALSNHGWGIALIFARTETRGFHRYVWERADSVFFFEGRINFHTPDGEVGGRPNAPSCLVSYSVEDTEIIKNSGLKGRLVTLRT